MPPNLLWQRPKAVKRSAAIAAVLLAVYGGYGAYTAISWEVTGKGLYSRGKYSEAEVVTREGSAVKFRQATNRVWAMSGVCFVVAIISFTFYRKLNECV